MTTPDRLRYIALGGGNEVGASSYLFEFPEARVLVDAGVRPKELGAASLPDLAVLDQFPPDAILLTHAHLDHVGALPLVQRRFPDVPIYATRATRTLAFEVLLDAVKVGLQAGCALYSQEDVVKTINAIRLIEIGEVFDLGCKVEPREAGHLLGAVSYLFESSAGVVLHGGDINNVSTLAAGGSHVAKVIQPVQALILESTYGDTTLPSRKSQVRDFIAHVRTVLARGGKVLIPTFALGRAQELLLILHNHIAGGQLPNVPIYLDGLVRGITQQYESMHEVLPEALQNQIRTGRQAPFLREPVRLVNDRDHRARVLNAKSPCVVLASSGMLSGGASPQYAKHWLEQPENALFIVGYQDAESPGRRLLALENGGELQLPTGHKGTLETVRVIAEVKRYYLSAHADRGGLISFAAQYPEGVGILMHGEPAARYALYDSLRSSRPMKSPANGEWVNLLEVRHAQNRAFIRPPSKLESLDPATQTEQDPNPLLAIKNKYRKLEVKLEVTEAGQIIITPPAGLAKQIKNYVADGVYTAELSRTIISKLKFRQRGGVSSEDEPDMPETEMDEQGSGESDGEIQEGD
jgi:uncharacterized protein